MSSLHRPRLTPANAYFSVIRQAQHASSKSRRNSDITVLSGAKCRSEAQTLAEAEGKYPVYLQKVAYGNPQKEKLVRNKDELVSAIQFILSWDRVYAIVRPVAPPRSRRF